jgi:hypothetical protein
MKTILSFGCILALMAPTPLWAQTAPTLATVVATCGTPPSTYTAGQNRPTTQNTSGQICDAATITPGGTQNTTPVATATDPGTTIVKSAALESNHVLKSSAGNLYSVYVTTGATAGWLLTYNGTAAPTAGGAAIAPVDCILAPANSTVGISMGGDPPDPYATGIVAIFSSSGCLTNTASATAYFKGRVK